MGVVLDAILRDHDVVLDPDPGATLEVDPRLDRDDVSRLQRVSRLAREPRDFVDVEPETVSETMSELPGELALVDDAPGGGVRVDAADPRSNGIQAGLLRCENDGVGLLDVPGEWPRRERPRVIRRVALDL